MMRKFLSWLLCGAMVLGMVPVFTLEAEATEVDVKAETLESFGFDLDDEALQDVINTSETPYGDYTFSLYSSEELAWTYGQEAQYYDTLKSESSDYSLGSAFTSSATYYPFDYGVSYISAVDFCADQEDGRDKYVAYYYATVNSSEDYTDLYLTVVNTETSTSATHTLGRLPFELEATYAEGFLAIAAGDYDGDGEDELAVYVPTNGNTDGFGGKPTIAFYEVNPESCAVTWKKDIDLSGGNLDNGHAYDFTGVSSIFEYKWENIREFPIIDLTSIEQYGSDADDLAVVINYTRDVSDRKVGNKYDDSYSSLYRSLLYIYKDYMTNSSDSEIEHLQWNWNEYGVTDTNKTGYTEAMMFAGGGAGDITGDGYYNELVVGGYRLENYNDSNDNLSQDEYLVTYFNYDATTDSYSVASVGQWISLDDDEYGGATDIDGGIRNKSDRFSTAYSPLQITAFAERGTGYADSVLVGELVLALGDTTSCGYGGDAAYPSSYTAPETDLSTGVSAFFETAFKVRFALPTKDYDEDDSRYDALITDAVAGNFMNSSDGKEQLYYTYVVRRSSDSYNTYVGGIGNVGTGDNDVMNMGKLTFTENDIVRFSSTGLGWQVDNATVSLAAPDRDWDGSLMRYTNVSPEYYFSDPHVLAVLQAAPYFGELVNAEYTEDTGSTSISYTEGSSGAVESSISINLGISFGFKAGISLGIDVTSIKSVLEWGITAGWANTTETSKSYTIGYSAVATDTVVLVMTPYIRYHYEVWDREAGEWSPMVVDIPQTPQVTQISVDDYDEIAASSDDMETIRDNLLYNSEPGDPSTYAVNAPDGYSSGQVVGTDAVSSSSYVTLGSAGGGISMSIGAETSVSNGITWGTSLQYTTEIEAVAAFAGNTLGASYDGGYSWTSMDGVEFEGEVADISSEFASDYSFQWLFGSRTAELNGEECVVLSYVVKNVTALPRSPLSLDIVGTDTDSLTLSWDGEGVDPEYYVVYRYLSDYGMYYAIGTVAGDAYDTTTGLYEYTDTDCDPDTTYAYAVKAFGYSSGVLRSGIYSPIAYGHTNPDGDTVIKITSQPENAEIRSGKSATFEIEVSPAPGGGDVNYIWQSYSSSDGWSNVDTTSGSTLTIADQTEDNDGDKYRCIIMQKVGSTIYTLYSNTVSVNVGLGGTTTTLEIQNSSGDVTATGQASATTTTATPVYSDVAMMVSVNGVGYYVYEDTTAVGTYYLIPTSSSDAVYCIPNAALSAAIKAQIDANESNKNYATASWVDDNETTYTVEKITQAQYFYGEEALQNSTGINNLDDKTVETVEGGTEITFASEPITSYIKYEFDGGTVIYQVDDDTAGTLYYLYDNDSYTQIYLGSVTLVNESDATQTTPDYKAVNLTATSYTYSTTITSGETMTLCAKVSEYGDSTATTDGYVTFVITNNETKESTSLTSALSSGACTATWSPSVAGNYSIVANYAGSSYFSASSSESSAFTTYQAGYSLMLTSESATMAIGQGQFFELTPTLYHTTITDSVVTTPQTIVGSVAYTNTNNTTGESTTAYSTDAVYTPTLTAVGNYTVVAAVVVAGETVTATANIAVTKNTVTIAVDSKSVATSEFDAFALDDVTYTIIDTPWVWDGTNWVDKTNDLKAMIAIALDSETALENLNVGSYTIYPTITDTDTDTYNAILAMNNITTQSSTLSVTAPKYEVSFSANTGGEVTGIIDAVVPITSGASVTEGSSVTVEAIPATGYTVNYWTLNDTALRDSDSNLITTSTQNFSVDSNTAYKVYFKVSSNNLTYSVATDSESFGALTANETNSSGVAVNSGDAIATSQAVYFTATPAEGYEVSGWTVDDDTVKNSDGTSYLNQTYTLSGMTASTDVQVSFAAITSYSVTAKAMDQYGNEIGTVSINAEPDENGTYPINSSLVLTANKPSASYTVAEWRIYAEDGNYTTINSTSTTYTISSLQKDMDIRVIFVSNNTYSLWYSIDDNGTIDSVTTGDGISLSSGGVYEGGIPVTVTVIPDTDYQVTAVTANGTGLDLQTGDRYNEGTYLLESLTADTTITVTTAEYDTASDPTASLAEGTYSTTQTVNLYTSNDDGVIYYSTDNISFYEYSDPIDVKEDTTIYAYVDGTYLQSSNEVSFTYTIAPELVSIEVTQQPTTLTYETGDIFISDGMVVTATDTLGDTKSVTGYTVTPSTFYTAGEVVTVTISYTEGAITKTTTLDVEVTEADTPPVAPTEINLASITTPDGLSFDYGVTETEILAELPTTAEMLLSDGTTVDATVIWTASTNYDSTLGSYQSFTISGTATLPEGVSNENTVSLNVTITIAVAGAPVPVTSISISPDTLTLYYDETLDSGNTGSLTTTILPSNAANQAYHWSSDNETVATVDENGQVTAMGVGVVTITATTEDGNLTASCTVIVEQVQYQVISTDLNNPTAQETLATELLTQLDVATLSADVYYQEVTLQFSTDGGDNWTTATAENFPDEGITFTLDYPAGHNKDSDYDYVILHQISGTGEIEALTYQKVDVGLQVTVYSLSPFAVAWTEGADDSSGDSGDSGSSGSSGGGGFGGGASVSTTTTADTEPTTTAFTDVDETAYYYDAVLWAVANGITAGITDTTFSPDGTCTRAQAVTFFWRVAGEPVVDCVNPFTDVDADDYYYEAVRWAVSQGITQGISETEFSPNADCTRGHIATFLYRAAGEPEVTGTSDFTDVSADMYYYNAVLWAVNEGITTGINDTTFSPNSDCTRGQIVTFLYRNSAE